jgi:DNA repair exonuclease SbcCD ATPase subunit
VRFVELRIDGFGKLNDRITRFDPRVNVVFGPNEAGKSTMTAALLATLYGFERGGKDDFRPWSGARFATALTYELADGRRFEVQREFERDTKGVRVYDANGNDASGECAVGKTVNPGHAHLGIPLEVFVNASFVAQGDVAIDGARAERITHALARALDGGPREDAALGALKRLDEALATYVGKKRATVNAPLKHLQDELGEAEERAEDMRARLRALDDVRARLGAETVRSADLDATLREHDRRGRALRAYSLRSRLDALREVRDDLAALAERRAEYADVEGFPSYLVAALDEHYRDWIALDALAHAQAEESSRNRFTPALAAELEERHGDGGAVDAERFAALEEAGNDAVTARNEATIASDRAQAARRAIDGGGDVFGAVVTAAAIVAIAAIVLAIVHEWIFAGATGLLAVALFALAWSRGSRRRKAFRTVTAMQRAADEAISQERTAAARVASVLEPLGVPTIEELARRRERYRDLLERRAEVGRLAERARTTRLKMESAAATFDDLAANLVPPAATRARTLADARSQEARKSARDGIDLRLSMLDVRRSDVLGSDDEFALERELTELLADGVEPAPPTGRSHRALEAERADLERRANELRSAAVATAAELRAAEGQIGDLPALDERVAHLRDEVESLERFERAIGLARQTIDERTREAHQKFARRLADYASTTFAHVTGDRYLDIRIDPTTLAVRVRVPESGEIVDVARLSAGTREQAYLVARLAMARMFAEGLETAPLLLDDPFAFWDETRIERGFPILEAAAADAQIILFTTSTALANAAAERGAKVIDLSAPEALVTSPRAS